MWYFEVHFKHLRPIGIYHSSDHLRKVILTTTVATTSQIGQWSWWGTLCSLAHNCLWHTSCHNIVILSKVHHDADTSLHVFADASPRAYGAAAYFQFGMNSYFVMSKVRAAPIKQHSLPRLELMEAVTPARLCSYIMTSLNATFSVCLWSDSKIVLSWIYSK